MNLSGDGCGCEDFWTGNISSLPLRDFDFSIESISDRVSATFGVTDGEFSEVKYLCTGSNAVVYTGIRKNKLLAIKMLRPKIKNKNVAVQEMNLECQILCKVDHPNIVRIFGAGEEPRKFIMMEHLEGGTLEDLLKPDKNQTYRTQTIDSSPAISNGISFQAALNIAIDLAASLQYLHDQVHPSAMIIHRGSIHHSVHLLKVD